MKKLYTSYFGNKAVQGNPNCCATSVRVPSFAPGMKHLEVLAPTWKLVDDLKSGRITEEVYKLKYLELLRKRGSAEDILGRIPDGAILLCYEKPGVFCHRVILAEWLTKECEGQVTFEEITT